MIVGDNVRHDGLVVRTGDIHVLGVQQSGQTKLSLCHIKGVVKVGDVLVSVKGIKVNQIRPVC